MRNLMSYSTVPDVFDVIETALTPWSRIDSGSYQLVETDKNENILYVSVPGYRQDDVEIEMQGGQLTIRGQPSESKTVIVPSKLDYKFSVSIDYRVEDATLEHGLLAIRLVRQHRAESVKIPVRGSV